MLRYLTSSVSHDLAWQGDRDPVQAAAGLAPGSYDLRQQADPLEITTRIVVGDDIPGGALRIAPGGSAVDLDWSGPDVSGPFLVQVQDADGALIQSGWIYRSSTRLTLPEGRYDVKIAASGEAGFRTKLTVAADGAPAAVNGIALPSGPQEIADFLKVAAPIGQGTKDGSTAAFSFLGEADSYTVQIRDDSGAIQTFETDSTVFTTDLPRGDYDWRAFSLPSWLDQPDEKDVAWHSLRHSAGDRPYDYILGQRPDRIDSVDELKLALPAEAIRLDDGSLLVSNTHLSVINRIFEDGTVEKVGGNYAFGYDPTDTSFDTPLARPTRFVQAPDGKVFFVDALNLALRQIDFEAKTITTIAGGPGHSQPEIVDGDLVGTGYMERIGFDSDGNLFFAAFPAAVTESGTVYSVGPYKIYRQADSGSWYDWTPTLTTAVDDVKRISDVVWHGDHVSVIVYHSDASRSFVILTETGELVEEIAIPARPGGGIAFDPVSNSVFYGSHTGVIQVSLDTFDVQKLELPFVLANVAGLSLSGQTLIITDSDFGAIFEYDLTEGVLEATYGDMSPLRHRYRGIEEHDGDIYLVDNMTPRILKSEGDGDYTVIAGTGEQGRTGAAKSGDDALATTFHYPSAFAVSDSGEIYVSESNHRVLKIADDGTVQIVAGGGSVGHAYGYSGDGGPAVDARFLSIRGLATGPDGTLYIADSYNHAIRVVDSDGIVHGVAGNGTAGMGTHVAATGAVLNMPKDMIIRDDGSLIVSDSWNNRVVEIGADGIIRPLAGMGAYTIYQGQGGFSGDGDDARLAELNAPAGLALHETDQTLFIADTFNNRIRYVDSAGDIHTLIGGRAGFKAGEQLNLPTDIMLKENDLYILDSENDLVLRLNDVDRTGDDQDNALDVAGTIANLGHFNRTEHVDADDVDYYDLTGYLGGLDMIVSVQSGTVSFETTQSGTTGTVVLGGGQSFIAGAQDIDWLKASSTIGADYRIDLVSYRNDYIGNTHDTAFQLTGSDPLSPAGNWWETVSAGDPDVYGVSGLTDTVVEISAGAGPLKVALLDAGGWTIDWKELSAGTTHHFDTAEAAYVSVMADSRTNYAVGLHEDTVGDDYTNSARVAEALANEGFYSVDEHVSPFDGDFFDFRDVDGQEVHVLSADDDLQLVLTDGEGRYVSHALMDAGEDLTMNTDDFDFLLVSSEAHASYSVNVLDDFL